MITLERSDEAYQRLAIFTEAWEEAQIRLQEIRVLTRAIRTLATTYCSAERQEQEMCVSLRAMTQAAETERNRLYQESSRLSGEMTRLNALLQNGVYNAD